MMGLDQSSSKRTRPGSSSPLIVRRDFKPLDLSSLPDGRSIAYSRYTAFITLDVCVMILWPLNFG